MKITGSGKIQKKIILLLLGGTALAFSSSPRSTHKILGLMKKKWRDINERQVYEAIRGLYASRLISMKEHRDGTSTFVLTEGGKQRALTYHAESMKIPQPQRWDHKWRIIFFDIPENLKRVRDALRNKLKQVGMIEYQKSVFIHPYPCADEVNFLIELYDARAYVRFVVAESIDNDLHIRRKFRLR